MFTGIITHQAALLDRSGQSGDLRLRFRAGDDFLEGCAEGDSISVSGVCLTALDIASGCFSADVSAETLACTTLGRLQAGDKVNLERAMGLSDRLDGHLVSGHVDGLARLVGDAPEGRSRRLEFETQAGLMRYIAVKGSVCLDGVSLTVNGVQGSRFAVNVIPHTLSLTTLGGLQAGDDVNLEVDLIARYLERLHPGKDPS
ncbi:MAG TPA: riboflavin synthase [Xanthomonadales bacterium]|nr:riboflavin synthase [Xanthomonadales bacterium]